jgi:hypothetical protein
LSTTNTGYQQFSIWNLEGGKGNENIETTRQR